LSYVGSLSLGAASEPSALIVFFLGGGSFSDIKGALLGGSFNHRQAIPIVSARNKTVEKRDFAANLKIRSGF